MEEKNSKKERVQGIKSCGSSASEGRQGSEEKVKARCRTDDGDIRLTADEDNMKEDGEKKETAAAASAVSQEEAIDDPENDDPEMASASVA